MVQLDEAGECSYLLLPDGASDPSVAQVQAGTAAGGGAALAAGGIPVLADYADARAVLTGLQQDTLYDAHIVCQDNTEPQPNVMPAVTRLPVKTAGAMLALGVLAGSKHLKCVCCYHSLGARVLILPLRASSSNPTDGNPPQILSASVGNFSADAALLNVVLNEAGRVFFQVAPDGSTPPDLSDLFALQPHPDAVDVSSFEVDRAEVVRSGPIANLESETDYVLWVTAEDNVAQANQMTTFETVRFRTPDVSPPTLTAAMDAVRGESFDLVLQIDEPGNVRCVAVLAGTGSSLAGDAAGGVPSAQLIFGNSPSVLFPEGLAGSVDATFTSSSLESIQRVGFSALLLLLCLCAHTKPPYCSKAVPHHQ